jgi:L-lactate dehydrogenase complex protein LldE
MPRDVALFIPCLTDQYYPRVGLAAARVLERLGCRVHYPPDQTCCGQQFHNNGYVAEARSLARHMLEVFAPYGEVVTPSASCCAMVRRHYPRLLPDEPAAAALAGRTWEFSEYLHTVLRADLSGLALPEPTAVTYHPACHLRDLGIADATPELLRRLGNVDFRPAERPEVCCGFGGTFALKFSAVSGVMAAEKASQLAATGAARAICNEAGCTMNLWGLCQRRGLSVRFQHVAELLAEAMSPNCP